MSSYSRQQLEAWLKNIELEPDKKILDVGGSQLPIQSRLGEARVFKNEFKILDLEVPHECKKKPDFVHDLNSTLVPRLGLGDNKNWERGTYDYAFAIEVMEYMWNPIHALGMMCDFLKQGGILYISFHFVYPVHNPVDQDYLRYTPNGARKLLKEAGFEIVEEVPRLFEHRSIFTAVMDEKMRPAKNYDEHQYQGILIKAKKV